MGSGGSSPRCAGARTGTRRHRRSARIHRPPGAGEKPRDRTRSAGPAGVIDRATSSLLNHFEVPAPDPRDEPTHGRVLVRSWVQRGRGCHRERGADEVVRAGLDGQRRHSRGPLPASREDGPAAALSPHRERPEARASGGGRSRARHPGPPRPKAAIPGAHRLRAGRASGPRRVPVRPEDAGRLRGLAAVHCEIDDPGARADLRQTSPWIRAEAGRPRAGGPPRRSRPARTALRSGPPRGPSECRVPRALSQRPRGRGPARRPRR